MERNNAISKAARLFAVIVFSVLLMVPVIAVEAAVLPTDGDGYMMITSAAQLEAIRDNTAGKYRLYADVNLTGYVSNKCTATKGWYPIGYGSPYFRGELDGQGYTISGLWSGSGWGISYKGLFSVTVGATIKNLNIELDARGITGGYEVGAVIGDARNGTLIENISVIGGKIITTGGGYAGGLVGHVYGSPSVVIKDCSVTGTYTKTSGNYSGGLVGVANNASIIRCKAVDTVSEGYSYVGGAVGGILGKTSLTDIYSSGTVKATASYAGGLVGAVYGNSSISGGYATGNVSASHYAGGLVGTLYGNSTLFKCCAYGDVTTKNYIAGGLVGEVISGTVSNCYARGDMKGTTGVGGLVGYFSGTGSSNNKFVENCFSSGEVTGTGTTEYGAFIGRAGVKFLGTNYFNVETANAPCAYGTSGSPTGSASSVPQGKTTTEISYESTFVGWDFEGVWLFNDDGSGPYFNVFWENDVPETTVLTLVSKSVTSITVSWTPVDGATGYEISYGGSVITITDAVSATISGLSPNTTYEIKARVLKGASVSGWSAVLTVVTDSGASVSVNAVYTYDALGRLKTATYASGLVITYNYDAGGNIIGITRTDG
jgi:YD repeat-containing protein